MTAKRIAYDQEARENTRRGCSQHPAGVVVDRPEQRLGRLVLDLRGDRPALRQLAGQRPVAHIDQLQPGQDTMLRLAAFNQRTTPELKGRVSLIAADLVTDQRTGVQHYPVRIAFAEGERERLGKAFREE